MMLRIVIMLDDDTDDPQGLKEKLAMDLERFGDVHVVDVRRMEPEQMRIGEGGETS